MNRLLVVIGTIFILLFFSGCTDQKDDNDGIIYELEVLNYSVITEAYSYDTGWESFGEGFKPKDLPKIVHNDGGVYGSSEYYEARYKINGTVRNIADHSLNAVVITLCFYDSNGTFLSSKQWNSFTKLLSGDVRDFEYEYDYFNDYFENIDDLEIIPGPGQMDFLYNHTVNFN